MALENSLEVEEAEVYEEEIYEKKGVCSLCKKHRWVGLDWKSEPEHPMGNWVCKNCYTP